MQAFPGIIRIYDKPKMSASNQSPEGYTHQYLILGQKINNGQIFGFTVNESENKTLLVYINGTAVNNLHYRDIPIVNHEDITIVYGSPPTKIPSYEFSY